MTVNMSGCNHNLEYLSVIAPFALAQGDGYKPYYYYGDDAADSDIIVDTPYRIITSNHAVSLSADLKSAILYSTEEMVDYYKRKFERAESRTTPFFLSLKTHESLLYYMEGLGQYSGAWHCIKPQPCFGLTQEQLETKMIREVPGIYESTKIQMRRIERQSKSNKESICLFCMEGLERFADQGYIDDMPRYLMQPFTKQERLTMLCAFKDAVNSDLITAVAADSSAFKLSKTISISLNIEGLYLAVVDGISRTFRVVRVNEESIKAAFLDFFSSLPGSSLVCPQSDMLQAVNSLIEKLGAMPD